jgi:hypothetical protein
MLLTTYSCVAYCWRCHRDAGWIPVCLALALALPLGGIELRSEKAERQDQMLRKGVEWMGRNASISWCEGKTRQVGCLIHITSFLRYKIQAVLHFFPTNSWETIEMGVQPTSAAWMLVHMRRSWATGTIVPRRHIWISMSMTSLLLVYISLPHWEHVLPSGYLTKL